MIQCIYSWLACDSYRYGEQCSEECECNRTTSEGCDAVTGKCHCKAGWTGSDCTQDVNECEINQTTCDNESYQTCVNTQGSSHCECLYGGVDIYNCTRMYVLILKEHKNIYNIFFGQFWTEALFSP